MNTETSVEGIVENKRIDRVTSEFFLRTEDPVPGVSVIYNQPTGSTYYGSAKARTKTANSRSVNINRVPFIQTELGKNVWVFTNERDWYIPNKSVMALLKVSDTYLSNMIKGYLKGNTRLCCVFPQVPMEMSGKKKTTQHLWSKEGLTWLVCDIMLPKFRLVNKLRDRLAYVREHYPEFDFLHKKSVEDGTASTIPYETVVTTNTAPDDATAYAQVHPHFYMDAIKEHMISLENKLVEKDNEIARLRKQLSEQSSKGIASFSEIFSLKGAGLSTAELEKRGFVGVDKLYYNWDNLWFDPATGNRVGLKEFRAVFRHTFLTEASTHDLPAVREIARKEEIADVFHVFCGKTPNPVDASGNPTKLSKPAHTASPDPHIRPQVLYYVPNATNLNWTEMLQRYRNPIPR